MQNLTSGLVPVDKYECFFFITPRPEPPPRNILYICFEVLQVQPRESNLQTAQTCELLGFRISAFKVFLH